MVIGGFFVCLQLVPYYIAISRGHTKTNIYIGIIVILLEIPLMFFCINKFGLIGASIPWLIMNLISFISMSLIIIRKFVGSEYLSWLIYDILIPIAITILLSYLIYIIPNFSEYKYFFILKAFGIFSLSLIVNIIIYNRNNPENLIIDFK
jgi:peptidoglycan biosynthesis protein MviN/MurJ (putative lipid II flippase)